MRVLACCVMLLFPLAGCVTKMPGLSHSGPLPASTESQQEAAARGALSNSPSTLGFVVKATFGSSVADAISFKITPAQANPRA